MPSPDVSFLIPCYNLAHFLEECVASILRQSFTNFEVLILDDCSPDHTPEVARSIRDPRVRHIRNEQNLGHLRNYNHGVRQANGRYIWLISADDRLRRPYIIERFIETMDANPGVGYACCPALSLEHGAETHLEGSVSHRDIVYPGRRFARMLLEQGNFVIAASGMVRRECYQKLGAFPLDLPYAGDWFLWLLFALHYDVAYFAEPMVNYRQHDLSMTNRLTGERFAARFKDGLAVLWRTARESEALGYSELVKLCRHRIAYQYAHNLIGRTLHHSRYTITVDEFETSLQAHASDAAEADFIRSRTWEIVADSCFRKGDYRAARQNYARARHYDGAGLSASAKQLLLMAGLGPTVVRLKEIAGTMHQGLGVLRGKS